MIEGAMSIRKKQDQEAGVALILAILGLLLLSAVALAMLFSSNTETSISINYHDKQSAIYGALAGLQEARDRIHPLTGDLGAGANLSAGGLNIVPCALPSTSAPNVLYLINPSPGETVAPWNPSNQYFDTELCHESYFVNNLGVTSAAAGTPCPTTSASVPSGNSWYAWYDNSQKKTNTGATGTGDAATLETAYQLKDSNGNKIPLTYKWVRITLKSDNMTPVSVGTGNGTQVCWNGSHEEQLPAGYIGYNTDCTPITGAVTNIAVTASGSGYTSAPTVTISGGGGSGAIATAVVGQLPVGVTSVTLTNPGAGYTSNPTVTFTPTDGNGSGATATTNVGSINLPVGSVTPTPANWASPPACYASATPAPTVIFNPAGATASVSMTGQTCVFSISASGKCTDSSGVSSVTAPGGFSGSVYWNGGGSHESGTSISNPGNYTAGSVPGTSAFTINCSNPGNGNNVPAVTSVTPGYQINTVSAAGGSYSSSPTVTFGGTTPLGGAPGATANLTGTPVAGAVTSLSLTGGGSGYDANPTLSIAAPSCTPGPSCVQATGTASIQTDYGVLSINITNAGSGYSQGNPPTVTISGGGGSGATATASVGSAGNTMGGVYLLTSLAVTPSGSRAMTQMEIGVNFSVGYTFNIGGGLTMVGPTPNFGTPHSNNFQIVGTDCPTCAPVPSGCNTTALPAKDAIGIDDPTNATNPSAVQSIISDLAKPNNYIGANSAPDVTNASIGNPSATQLNEFVGEVASAATNVYGTPSAPVNNPTINLGTAANPAIDVVYGNYSMGPSTGYGVLVVTGTLTFSGNYSWDGLILVIGNGASIMSGGGNGEIVGGVFVANTSGSTFGSPNVSWNGGGGNGIQYDHCWADYMLSKIPPLAPTATASALQIISLRTQVY
jgi:hypothetical protein